MSSSLRRFLADPAPSSPPSAESKLAEALRLRLRMEEPGAEDLKVDEDEDAEAEAEDEADSGMVDIWGMSRRFMGR